MSDFAKPIANALKQVFPDILHSKCFYHLKSNVKKKFPKQFKALEIYIDNIGRCITISNVDKLWDLAKKEISKNKELENIADDFIDYFKKV